MLLCALAVVALAQEPAPTQAGTITLATYKIAGRDVAATIPDVPGPFGENTRRIEYGGWKYLVDGNGNLVRSYRANGGWSELRARFEEAKTRLNDQTPEWRVKVFVMNRVDVLDKAENGVLRYRRQTFDQRNINLTLDSLALFAAMIEAYSGGHLKARIDAEFDADYARLDAEALKSPETALEFFREYVKPRVNGGEFEAEDRVYRGPYDSVFCVHSGLFGDFGPTEIFGMPLSAVSYYLSGEGRGPRALSFALYDQWLTHLGMGLAKHGFRVSPRWLPVSRQANTEEYRQGFLGISDPSIVVGENWAKTLNRTAATTDEYASASKVSASLDSAKLQRDGVLALPRLVEDLGSRLNGAEVAVTVSPASVKFGHEPPNPGNEIAFGRNALSSINVQGKRYVATDAAYAGLVASSMFNDSAAVAVARVESPGGTVVIFDAHNAPSRAKESDSFEVQGNATQNADAPQFGNFTTFVSGNVTAKTVEDSTMGNVLEIKLGQFPRSGRVFLTLKDQTPEAAKARYLTFSIKTDRPEPMELQAVGPPIKALRLFGTLQTPAEVSYTEDQKQLEIRPSDQWQTVTVDLQSLFPGEGILTFTRIGFATNRFAQYWEPTQIGVEPTIWIANVKLSAEKPTAETTINEVPNVVPSADSPDPLARAAFAASVQSNADAATIDALTKLFKDQKEFVRTNAAAAFQRVRSLAAEPALINLSRGIEPRTAQQAALSLKAQGTETALAALRRTLEIGPYDFSREFAAEALMPDKNPKYMDSLSVLLTLRSWRARAAGAQAIGTIPGGDAEKRLSIFLYELDPAIRLTATRLANPNSDAVCRRLLWSAVNDSSDAVRLESYLKLMQSPDAAHAAEGAKGVRDDSIAVRLALLEHMRDHPSESYRSALRLAVTDSTPEVRAAALRAFAKIPGAVSSEEVANVLSDNDPRVRSAMKELSAAKSITLPH